MFNVNTIQSIREAEIELKHPVTGEPLGASITLLSSDHPDRRTAIRDYNRVLRKIGDGDSEDQIAQRTEAHRQYIASCVAKWKGISLDGTAETPFSTGAVVELFSKPELDWLYTQVQAGLVNEKNFIAAPPKA